MRLLHRLMLIAPLALAACATPAPQNTDLAQYYAAAEAQMLERGLMRTQTAPKDAPFSYDDLVRNFQRIALFDEYKVAGGRYVAQQSPSHLRRWEGPVRVGMIFGNSTLASKERHDRAEVAAFTRRLSHLTRLDMRTVRERDANFLVLFLNDAEQKTFADILPQRFPNIDPAVVDAFRNSPLNVFCAAFAFPKRHQKGVYDHVLILVKTEHGDLVRKSCIHEEMAQAMGLTNDSPDARPSIFNDDEEFAFLTKHDEILLQMLYDPRLNAGMRANEVSPLLPQIARDAAGAGL